MLDLTFIKVCASDMRISLVSKHGCIWLSAAVHASIVTMLR